MQSEERRCVKCGDIFTRKPKEAIRDWKTRRYCSRSCYCGNRSAKPIWRSFTEQTVLRDSGCIEWLGYTDRKGYGRFSSAGGEVLAHRLAYMMHFGADISGKQVLHRCDNRRCCNPHHLFLGTHQDNMDDMKRKGRSPRRFGAENPNYRHGKNCSDDPKAAEIRRVREEREAA